MLSNEMVKLVKSYCSWEPTIDEIEAAEEPAKRKLADLINRFGDDNGKRLQPKYLAQLIMEHMRSNRMARYCAVKSELNRLESKKKTASTEVS